MILLLSVLKEIKRISPGLRLPAQKYISSHQQESRPSHRPPRGSGWYTRLVVMGNKLLKVAEIAFSQTGCGVINVSEAAAAQASLGRQLRSQQEQIIYVWLHPEPVCPEPTRLTVKISVIVWSFTVCLKAQIKSSTNPVSNYGVCQHVLSFVSSN